MLKDLIRHRPRHLLAVYVEPGQIEVLHAHRRWRTWQLEESEQIILPEGESLYEGLERLSLKSRGHKGTALLLFLPRTLYSFHREHYPIALREQLEEALHFDWQENIFHEQDRSVHFFGPATPVGQHLSVPIFSLQAEVYEKFHQVLSAEAFQSFTVIPSALVYRSFLSSLPVEADHLPLEMVARVIDSKHMEIHRFYNDRLLDSMVIGRQKDHLKLFRENLHCLDDGECQGTLHMHLLCTSGECAEAADFGSEWKEDGLPLRIHVPEESILTQWVKYLLEQDQIQTFDAELLLKPWKVPRVAWAILVLFGLYSAFAAFQSYSLAREREQSRIIKKQIQQLDTQWKPIEQLQTRVSKFQEDRKTITEFTRAGYPLRDILVMLTMITPEDTSLNYLSLRKDQLVLRGDSKSAIRYLSELAKVEGFSDVRFASPVTRNPNSDQERFNVQMQVDVEKLKKSFETLGIGKEEEADEKGAEEKNLEAESPVPPSADQATEDEAASDEESPPEDMPPEEEPGQAAD